MLKSILVVTALFACLFVGTRDDVSLEGVKCIIMGKAAAKADKTVDYKEGKVYLCCPKCVATFSGEPTKFAVKANHQLVLTKQYEQTACPLSGGKIDSEITADVGGVKVAFCCKNCQGKVESAEGLEAKAELVFAEDNFSKGFAAKADDVDLTGVKCFLMPKKDALAEKSADFGGGKVYFCCDGCLKKFNAAPEKYTTKANQQLYVSKQVKQTNCPISGSAVDSECTLEVNGAKVAYCCDNCKGKVEAAEGDEAKADLVFGKDAFAKGFGKK